MMTLTDAQRSLYSRLQMLCLASGGCLTGTYAELCRSVRRPGQHQDLMTLLERGLIRVCQHGEQWHLWIVQQGER